MMHKVFDIKRFEFCDRLNIKKLSMSFAKSMVWREQKITTTIATFIMYLIIRGFSKKK